MAAWEVRVREKLSAFLEEQRLVESLLGPPGGPGHAFSVVLGSPAPAQDPPRNGKGRVWFWGDRETVLVFPMLFISSHARGVKGS